MFGSKNKTLEKGGTKRKAGSMGSYAVLGVALLAMTFFGFCSPQQGGQGLRGMAGSVANEEISNADFSRAYESYSSRLRQQYGDQFDSSMLRVAHSVMDQLISARVLYIKAVELGLSVSEDEVVKMLSEAAAFRDEKGEFSSENFRNYLRYNRYSEASFMEEMQRNLTVQKLREFVSKSMHISKKAAEIEFKLRETKLDLDYVKIDPKEIPLNISKADIDAFLAEDDAQSKVEIYYKSHTSDFVKEAKVKAQHILVGYKGARRVSVDASKRSKEDARQLAEEILASVKVSGANFSDIAKKRSDEPSGKKSGGDLGFFAKGDMAPAFSEAAFALKPGAISKLVATEFGFHIIKVNARQEAEETTMAQATREIVKKLIQRDRAPTFAKEFADQVHGNLLAGKPVDALLKGKKIAWKKTGLFSINANYIAGLGAGFEVKEAAFALRKKGELHKKVLKVSGAYFVLRLAQRVEASMEQFDDEQAERLASSNANVQGYALFSELERKSKKELEDRKVIFRNPSYLALDDQQDKS